MADLVFDGTAEQRRAQLESFCRKISADFYGNGRTGVMQNVQDFMTEVRTEKKIEKERHEENKSRLNLIIILLGLLCTIILTLIAVRGFQKTSHIITKTPTAYSAKR